ncbi:MAG: AAA family ATPase, partial [Deltaproteobacteria bacterium]
CVVLGAVGMGKSRLRHEAMARVVESSPETVFLSARCEVFRRDSPFAPIMDALADVVDASVVKIFTAVADGGGDPVAAMDRARGSFEAILRGLSTDGPVVLTIDDAQWLAGPSQSAIRQVFESAQDLPLAIWLFGRPEAREIVQRVLPQASVVELKPLGKVAAEKLLVAVAGEANEQVLERAGGHPLFLEELGRMFATRGVDSLSNGALPPSIEGAHLAQLDQLEPNDREFVKRAAVFGRTAWLDGVVSLGGDGAAIERLKPAQIFAQRPRSRFEFTREFSFRSAVARDVAYGLWTEAMRPRLHERAATWLAAREGVGPDEIAQHWELAGETLRAAEAYTAAAELSSMVSDMATTCAQVERALALAQDPGLRWRALVARDHALQNAGDRSLEREGLEELERLAADLGPVAQAEVAWRKCYFARLTGDREDTLEAGARALELAAEAGDARWGSSAHIELAMLYAGEGRYVEAAEHAAGARRLANKTADEWLRARAIGTQAYVASEAGDAAQTAELFEMSAARYQRAGDRRREAIALANAASVMLDLGRIAQSAAQLESVIEASRRVGNARTVAVATHNLGVIRRMEGALDAAAKFQALALVEGERLKHPRLAASANSESARLALARGNVDDATAISDTTLATAEATRSPHLIAGALAVRLQAYARAGRRDESAIARARALLPALEKLP